MTAKSSQKKRHLMINDTNTMAEENNSSQENKRDAITLDGQMPQKKFYRSRAHCNPLSHNDNFQYPINPTLIDWTQDHYPHYRPVHVDQNCHTPTNASFIKPTVLDIGCGFGGLTIALSKLLPHEFILGLEIRAKVTEYVRLRIMAHRQENISYSTNIHTDNDDHLSQPSPYQNCSVLRTNSMKFMPNFFSKHSLSKIFFCFPDPHFKKKNHARRIVSDRLLSEYAYVLKPKHGRLYTITDVEDLHLWHLEKCKAHPLYRQLSEEEMENDVCVKAMYNETEEGKKVERAGAKKYYAVFERIDEKEVGGADDSESGFWDEGNFGVFDNESLQ